MLLDARLDGFAPRAANLRPCVLPPRRARRARAWRERTIVVDAEHPHEYLEVALLLRRVDDGRWRATPLPEARTEIPQLNAGSVQAPHQIVGRAPHLVPQTLFPDTAVAPFAGAERAQVGLSKQRPNEEHSFSQRLTGQAIADWLVCVR